MIQVTDLSFSFPEKELYNKVSFHVPTGAHCALIGTNGSGKTTLIDLLTHWDTALYDGKIVLPEHCRIGHTAQFYHHDRNQAISVYDFMGQGYFALQTQMADVCTQMETATDLDPLMDQYQQVLDALEIIGGDDFLPRMEKMLNLAGLMSHRDAPISTLSGGEFKLVQMMAEMLQNPDLMIMDEPDVFLDFENLNALRRLINSHKGTLLVITHNRYLLNHCFNQVLHLEHKSLQQFDGRYMDYRLSLLNRKIELLELAHADTEEVERNDLLIERLRKTATDTAETVWGRALKARVKIQERLTARRIEEPFVFIRQPEILFSTPSEPDPDKTLLTLENYQVAFDRPLLSQVNFALNATDKVALIGPNGTGKTTLLREIFQSNKESIHRAEGLDMAYFSQNHLAPEPGLRVHEVLAKDAFETEEERDLFLATYGFEEDALYQKVSDLSGGERTLLELAKLSTRTADLLLLDEPTSHLDTDTQVTLENAIQQYPGSILMVSHDFYFIANCMDYVLLIEGETVRKMSIRAFRKMIYANHFDKDYLALEQKKQGVELDLALTLQRKDFEGAKVLLEKLTDQVSRL